MNIFKMLDEERPLTYDGSRCLNNRQRNDRCLRCQEACPHGCIDTASTAFLHQAGCSACGLCVSLCPTGALSIDVSSPRQMKTVDGRAVISCRRIDATGCMDCVGRLSALNMALLSLEYNTVILKADADMCCTCNNGVFASLEQRALQVNQFFTRLGIKNRVVLMNICGAKGTLNRRELFSLCLSRSLSPLERIVELAQVQQNERARLVEQLACMTDCNDQVSGSPLFFGLTASDRCDLCGLCSKVCMDAALEIKMDGNNLALRHSQSRCRGCCTCGFICPKGALCISSAESRLGIIREKAWVIIKQSAAASCIKCGKTVASANLGVVCEACAQSERWNRSIY